VLQFRRAADLRAADGAATWCAVIMSLDGSLAEALPASAGPVPRAEARGAGRRPPGEIPVVTAGAVRLTWRGHPAAAPERCELRPNQSRLAASGAIVDGPVWSRRAARGARR
jgi:hypothetical protein